MTPDPQATIEVRLEIALDAQPIHGTLSLPGGPANPFLGWLGLTAALEQLRLAEGKSRGGA